MGPTRVVHGDDHVSGSEENGVQGRQGGWAMYTYKPDPWAIPGTCGLSSGLVDWPWDNPNRRPSHADKRWVWRRELLEEEIYAALHPAITEEEIRSWLAEMH